jgi:hypothetical protein
VNLDLKVQLQRGARREPFIVALVIVFILVEITAVLIIEIASLLGWP